MTSHKLISALLVITVVGLAGCGGATVGSVRGQLTVDGSPAEVGTVSFKPTDNPTGRGAGAAISAGQFQLSDEHGLKPGKYVVSAQVSKSTGKTYNDPQKGQVPVLQSLTLTDSPKEIEITSDNADELQIAFSTKGK